jgi:hypothetical protein
MNPNNSLDPRVIREWAHENRPREDGPTREADFEDQITLMRNREDYRYTELRVTPILVNGRWTWVDRAGYPVAQSASRELRFNVEQYDFVLNVPRRLVTGVPYLTHRKA